MLASKYSFRLFSKERITDTPKNQKTENVVPDNMESDSKKRSFLKLAGVVGVGAVAASLLPHKAEALVFGSTPTSNTVGLKNSNNVKIAPAQETGGNLAIIAGKDFATQTTLSTLAKESGGNLAAIAANTANIPAKGQAAMIASTPVVIASNQSSIPVTATISGTIGPIGIVDTKNTLVNPASDDSILYLRRIVKLMESQAVVDSGNRQRVTIDSVGPGTAVTSSIPVNITAGTLNTVTNLATLAGQNQQMFQDVARNAFANGVRNNLIFS